ncbi:MAG: YceD family protein [Gallionella sp.]
MYARPFIDSLDFALNGQQISAQVPFVALSRFVDVLEDTQGALSYLVQGGLDNQGRPVLDVSITGRCQLQCQRCLTGVDYMMQHKARLLLCDQAGLDVLGDDEEAFDGILADAHMDVVAVLEDEILLSLPISVMHEIGTCQVVEGKSSQKDNSHPFAVLKKLKIN